MDNKTNEIKGICCDVTSCKYHDTTNGCCAGKIHVGRTGAKSCDETACETFTPCENC